MEKDIIPFCPDCGTVLKPNIIFFGEPLPSTFTEAIKTEFKKCDCIIVIGTSLKVYPFAGLVDLVADTVPRLLINQECVGPFVHGAHQDKMQGVFNKGIQGTYRDVAYIGDIDEGVDCLMNSLGWSF